MKKTFLFTLLLLLCATFGVVEAQKTELPAFVKDSLDNYINKGLADWNIPGLSVAVVKDGKVVVMKGYGVTKVGGTEAVDENTLFMIGSNTKAFTATALAILQEAGKVDLNDKVQKWMPEFRLRDTLASNDIRICDLLSHRIGFETFQGDFTYWTSNLTRAEIIKKMALVHAPYPFRTRWGYCNAAFVAAGELIPIITGRQWEDVIRDSILIPLNMNRTLVLAGETKNVTNIASPHTIVGNKTEVIPFANLDNLAAAGSIMSSAKDMSNWLLAQLGNGMLNNKQEIPANAILALRTPYSIIASDPRDNKTTHFYLYGLGLGINDFGGKMYYSHTGGVDGFLSVVIFMPEENLGIVVMTNNDQNRFFLNVANEIRDAFLGLPYKNYSKTSLEQFNSSKKQADERLDSLRNVAKQGNKPSLPLESFTGKYNNDLYGDILISAEKGKLKIAFTNHPTLIGNLEYLSNDTFLCTYSNPEMGIMEMPFRIKDGKVEGLTLTVSDFLEFLPYDFVKVE